MQHLRTPAQTQCRLWLLHYVDLPCTPVSPVASVGVLFKALHRSRQNRGGINGPQVQTTNQCTECQHTSATLRHNYCEWHQSTQLATAACNLRLSSSRAGGQGTWLVRNNCYAKLDSCNNMGSGTNNLPVWSGRVSHRGGGTMEIPRNFPAKLCCACLCCCN